MTLEEIRHHFVQFKTQGLKIFATSSFQTQSVVLLHIISTLDKSIPVYFLNSGYHFAETLEYKDRLGALLGLRIINLYPVVSKNQQLDEEGRLLFTSNPDYCCYLNKVAPLIPVLSEMDVWINGIRRDQSKIREKMHYIESAEHDVIRFHPILGWSSKQVEQYIEEHRLPRHPLEKEGYLSIGCEPCTVKVDLDMLASNPRLSRWYGLNKTECGLHTQLIENNNQEQNAKSKI